MEYQGTICATLPNNFTFKMVRHMAWWSNANTGLILLDWWICVCVAGGRVSPVKVTQSQITHISISRLLATMELPAHLSNQWKGCHVKRTAAYQPLPLNSHSQISVSSEEKALIHTKMYRKPFISVLQSCNRIDGQRKWIKNEQDVWRQCYCRAFTMWCLEPDS